MSNTPKGERVNICFIGKTNVGKSSIINTIIGQEVSIVSTERGTTTDPVIRRFELIPAGPVTFFDTAGYDDTSILGEKRLKSTKKAIFRADFIVLVIDNQGLFDIDRDFIHTLCEMKIPYLVVQNKTDMRPPTNNDSDIDIIPFTCDTSMENYTLLKENFLSTLTTKITELHAQPFSLVKDFINKNDKIILVMPIDDSAPKGRIILPQVQVLREILDVDAIALCCTEKTFAETLKSINIPPKLVITDTQVVELVDKVIETYPSIHSIHQPLYLTTFSILFARYRGELKAFLTGLKALSNIKETDHILIAEACAHHIMGDDIGQFKIPKLLEKYLGFRPQITKVNGHDFPDDLEKYKLVIHCGGCMMTRREILRRINECQRRGVQITNYGLIISQMHGILHKVIQIFTEYTPQWKA